MRQAGGNTSRRRTTTCGGPANSSLASCSSPPPEHLDGEGDELMQRDIAAGMPRRQAYLKMRSRVKATRNRAERAPERAAVKVESDRQWHEKYDTILAPGDLVPDNEGLTANIEGEIIRPHEAKLRVSKVQFDELDLTTPGNNTGPPADATPLLVRPLTETK